MEKISNDCSAEINALLRELKRVCDNELLTNLTEEEAAKRLAIGTKTGKFHSKSNKKLQSFIFRFKILWLKCFRFSDCKR